jgi:hypothetical protein
MLRRGAQEALLNRVHLESWCNLIVLDEAPVIQIIPLSAVQGKSVPM